MTNESALMIGAACLVVGILLLLLAREALDSYDTPLTICAIIFFVFAVAIPACTIEENICIELYKKALEGDIESTVKYERRIHSRMYIHHLHK